MIGPPNRPSSTRMPSSMPSELDRPHSSETDRERQVTGDEGPLRAELPGEPAGQRHGDRLGDRVGGDHPRALASTTRRGCRRSSGSTRWRSWCRAPPGSCRVRSGWRRRRGARRSADRAVRLQAAPRRLRDGHDVLPLMGELSRRRGRRRSSTGRRAADAARARLGSSAMRTGRRCTTLIQLPVAFCAGTSAKAAPVPPEKPTTRPWNTTSSP